MPIIIGALVIIFIIASAVVGLRKDDSPAPPKTNAVAATPAAPAKKAPVVSIDDAKVSGDTLTLDARSATPTITVRATDIDPAAGDVITVNGQPTTRTGALGNKYTYVATIQAGQNTLTVSAKNSGGQTDKQLIISYDPAAVAKAAADKAVADALLEAEVTCQQHAEKYFGVKDINISYDQSSIRRANPDGTLLVKANIADANGVFGAQKPLGVMECTTTADGMTATAFRVY